MPNEICPMHSDEEVMGTYEGPEVGWVFTCPLTTHPQVGPYTWTRAPEPPGFDALSGIAAELGLEVRIADVLGQRPGVWVEYGVLEQDFALAYPDDWAFLIDRYGHTAIAATRYSTTSFLAGALSRLGRAGVIEIFMGPATGRWGRNGVMKYPRMLYLALPPAPHRQNQLSCDDAGVTVDYIPGQGET